MVHRTKNRRIKCYLTFLFSFVVTLPAFSQFDAQMSQYMFNMPEYNPASIAENGMINASLHIRKQWLNMPGAPFTTFATINAPLATREKAIHGLGAKFTRDEIGAFNNLGFHLQYAYKRKIGKSMLSLGADFGAVTVGFVYDSIRAEVNSEYHDFLGDEAIPTADDTGSSFDLSLGAFYSAPKYYLGVSYVHLNAPRIKLNDDRTQFNIKGKLYATGGYDISFREPKWQLRSSALFKSDFVTWQAEVSSRMEFDQKFWGGLSYRYQDAVVVFGGASLMNGLVIGFSYDVSASNMIKANWGSPEVLISYSFNFDFGNSSRYKSIRIL